MSALLTAAAIAGGSAIGGAAATGIGAGVQNLVSKKARKAHEGMIASEKTKMLRGELVSDAEEKALDQQLSKAKTDIGQQTGEIQRQAAEQLLSQQGGGGLSTVTGRGGALLRELTAQSQESLAGVAAKKIGHLLGLQESRRGQVFAS